MNQMSIQTDIAGLKVQVGRMVSDIESEKETRARSNASLDLKIDSKIAHIESQIREVAASQNKLIGGLIAFNVIVMVALKFWKI